MIPFNPRGLGTFAIANATSSSAAVALKGGDAQYVFYNSSATAIAYVEVTNTEGGSTARPAVVPTTSVNGSFPIPPGAQVRITLGTGSKSLTAIASAADGNLYVTPGNGN